MGWKKENMERVTGYVVGVVEEPVGEDRPDYADDANPGGASQPRHADGMGRETHKKPTPNMAPSATFSRVGRRSWRRSNSGSDAARKSVATLTYALAMITEPSNMHLKSCAYGCG